MPAAGNRGYIPPLEFIPVAEDLGKIDEIGAWSLTEACTIAASWPGAPVIAVNISALQFTSGRLVRAVSSALMVSELAAHRLELEITESLPLEDSPSKQHQLRELKAQGVKISLDDFGTGYSALNYPWRFPLDKIKIDRGFIQAIELSRSARGVLCAIVDLGKKLDVSIVAEGVENDVQRMCLAELGCDLAQGYLFSRPVPNMDLPAIVLRDTAGSFLPAIAHAAQIEPARRLSNAIG